MNLENRVRGKLCKGVDGQGFIPDAAINELSSLDTVQRYLEFVLRQDSSHPSIVELVKYVTNQTGPAKKVFLILVLCGHLEHLSSLLQAGFSDKHLPIECDWNSTTERYIVTTWREPETHGGSTLSWEAFGGWPAAHVTSFAENQWIFLAPVFTPHVFDFVLPQRCPFPILKKHDHSKRGYAGSVYEVKIHEDHMQIELGTKSIAMKEMLPNKNDYYLKEAASLRIIRELKHDHLIQPLAAYRRSGGSGLCGFLFPWAEGGNLEEFWKRPTKRAAADPELMKWFLNQLRGLSGATEALHLKNCRHTDLKPLNILLFHEGDSPGTLRIADVGLAKIHDDITRHRQEITNAKTGSLRYEPPEFRRTNQLSRVFDVWSLGCVFLEFLTWTIYGWGRLNDLVQHTDRFWMETDDGPQLHSEVKALVEEMRRDLIIGVSETALTECLVLVSEKMLVPDWETRSKVSDVHLALRNVCKRGKEESYLLNKSLPSLGPSSN
ncbi:protein kinase domain-containing protein [Colletotrichum chrysophilum]|uniref:Protein kinase domain-containing protein n=1 Tax=Colletotrichum chrysophilum TaxID=1836956 RepID=A0AAD9AMD5_9PEZI|nr:protein kinase domain-containing protein [Colletotrichum chrysophilum]